MMQRNDLLFTLSTASTSVSPEKECGQLIANLVLALFGCHLQRLATSKSYIQRAYANLLRLSSQGCTVRADTPAKMVRFSSEGFGSTGTVFLPLLDGVLLLPSIDIKDVAGALRTYLPQSPIIHFTDIGITYHRLRLRTGRLSQGLADLIDMDSSAAVGILIQDILAQCLYPPVPPADALDQADDYLTLALNLVRLDNYPLAGIALAKADSALRDYVVQSNMRTYSGRADKIRTNLAGLGDTLAALAS